MASLINEDRSVWLKGLSGAELSLEDEVAFQKMFVAVRLAYGGVWQRSTRLDTRTTDSVEKQFAYWLFTYPGLRHVWEKYLSMKQERSEAYRGQGDFPLGPMDSRVEEILLQLDNSPTEVPETKLFTPWF